MDKQKENKSVSYRLPKKVRFLITILSEKMLISKTAVITLAILHFAEKENVTIEEEIRCGGVWYGRVRREKEI